MYKKVWCTCEVVVLLIKPIVFLTFSMSSASLDLKVPFNYLQQQQMQQTNVSKKVLPPRVGVQMKKLHMVLSIISLFTITRYNLSPPWLGIISTGLDCVTITARCLLGPDAVRTVRSLAAWRCHWLLKVILCCKVHETADSSIPE